MNRNDDTKLWELLGKADSGSASPLFTQNVLNAIRAEEERAPSPFAAPPAGRGFFSRRAWTIGLSAAAALCVSLFIFQNGGPASAPGTEMMPLTVRDLSSLEETATALEQADTDTSIIEMASCYSESLSEEEMQYMLAYL